MPLLADLAELQTKIHEISDPRFDTGRKFRLTENHHRGHVDRGVVVLLSRDPRQPIIEHGQEIARFDVGVPAEHAGCGFPHRKLPLQSQRPIPACRRLRATHGVTVSLTAGLSVLPISPSKKSSKAFGLPFVATSVKEPDQPCDVTAVCQIREDCQGAFTRNNGI